MTADKEMDTEPPKMPVIHASSLRTSSLPRALRPFSALPQSIPSFIHKCLLTNDYVLDTTLSTKDRDIKSTHRLDCREE